MTATPTITPMPSTTKIDWRTRYVVDARPACGTVLRVALYTMRIPRHATAIVAPTSNRSRCRHGDDGFRRKLAAGSPRGTVDTVTSIPRPVERRELHRFLRLEAREDAEDPTGRRRRRRGSETGLLHDHRDHVLRRGRRPEPDEQRRVLLGCRLRRSGLSGDVPLRQGEPEERVVRSAAL